jgi:Glycosyl transferase family 11
MKIKKIIPFFLFIFLINTTMSLDGTSFVPKKKKRPHKCVNGKYYVSAKHHGGQLGNQLFQIAAALSLAIDHDAEAVFPEYGQSKRAGIPVNREKVYSKINMISPKQTHQYTFFEHPDFHYKPISYRHNMRIAGYFQSEKYFQHNKEKILPYFEASDDVTEYLTENYSDLINHPQTVAIHLRGYYSESSDLTVMFPYIGADYAEKAALHFPEETLFVIFSDYMEWAKEELKDFSRPHIFIEGNTYYQDFYLISLMKHQIISNSSFSWWAAYLNNNPNKQILAPWPWFQPNHHLTDKHILPKEWIKVQLDGYY